MPCMQPLENICFLVVDIVMVLLMAMQGLMVVDGDYAASHQVNVHRTEWLSDNNLKVPLGEAWVKRLVRPAPLLLVALPDLHVAMSL